MTTSTPAPLPSLDVLPLPDPFPDYAPCPQCGEPEVEVWCYQTEVVCHLCGAHWPHTPPPCVGSQPICAKPGPSR